MQILTSRSIETKVHPQTKMMFWYLFASSRGAPTRIRIVKLLQKRPYNTHQLSKELAMDYKAVKHHITVLEKNSLLEKFDGGYGATYFLTPLFEENQAVVKEIKTKMNF